MKKDLLMSSTSYSLNDLPYDFPQKPQDQLNTLADILGIPRHKVKNGGSTEIDAMIGTILYRHLDVAQRQTAMTDIRAVASRSLMGDLIDRALQTTFVNKSWGLWSLTNNELNEYKETRETISKYASLIGIGATALDSKNLINDIFKNKKMNRKHVVILVIWAAVYVNSNQLNNANIEWQRRHSINSSTYHGR